jgi:alkaline phosphatase
MGDETNADISYGFPADTGRKDLTEVDTQASGYHQEALVPLDAETHGGEDVAVYATGPGASAAIGVYEQNLIFHIINRAAELERKAKGAQHQH